MEQTPLQRYQRAYHLHHSEKKPREASRIYHELAESYPGSDVALYASTQLSTIQHPETATEEPRKVHSHPAMTVGMILTIFNLLLTAIVITGFLLYNNSVEANRQGMSKIIQALGKLYGSKEYEALSILNDAKIILKADITPYAVSADIYCRKRDYIKARQEFEAFDRLYPGLSTALQGIKAVNTEEDAYAKALKKQQTQQDSLTNKESKKNDSQLLSTPYREPEKEPAPRVINHNDVSYF